LKKEKVFIADYYYNIETYSTDKHSLLKKLIPKNSINNNKKKNIGSIKLVATENEEFIYYLTPD
jgi:hypothetical protein